MTVPDGSASAASQSTRAKIVLEVIHARRSNPNVLPDEPPRHVIQALLEAANCAPNHYLTQPWRFFVLRGDARLRLGEVVADAVLRRGPAVDEAEAARRRTQMAQSFLRAPVVIAAAAMPPGHPHVGPWEELAATSAAIQNLLLAAEAMGLAGFWRSNGTALPEVIQHLGLPAEAQMVGFVYIAYPDSTKPLLPTKRQPCDGFVQWMGWE